MHRTTSTAVYISLLCPPLLTTLNLPLSTELLPSSASWIVSSQPSRTLHASVIRSARTANLSLSEPPTLLVRLSQEHYLLLVRLLGENSHRGGASHIRSRAYLTLIVDPESMVMSARGHRWLLLFAQASFSLPHSSCSRGCIIYQNVF